MPQEKTLRDEFALVVVGGLYAKAGTSITPPLVKTVARIAYTMADALMVERDKPVRAIDDSPAKDDEEEFHRILDELIESLFTKK